MTTIHNVSKESFDKYENEVRFCSLCGAGLVREKTHTGYQADTGEKGYTYCYVCPNRSRTIFLLRWRHAKTCVRDYIPSANGKFCPKCGEVLHIELEPRDGYDPKTGKQKHIKWYLCPSGHKTYIHGSCILYSGENFYEVFDYFDDSGNLLISAPCEERVVFR